MQAVDRGLSWLLRVTVTGALMIGVVIPPMLLRLINELSHTNDWLGWRIALVILYFAAFFVVIGLAGAVTRHYTGEQRWRPMKREDLGFVLTGYLAIIISESVFEMINRLVYHQTQTQNNAAIKSLMIGSPWAFWLMAFSAVFLTPIMEEMVFRGVLTNLFFKQEWLKILLSGLVFGSLHSSSTIPSFLIYVGMGLILASVYRLTGKLQDSILLHFLINLGAMGFIVYSLLT